LSPRFLFVKNRSSTIIYMKRYGVAGERFSLVYTASITDYKLIRSRRQFEQDANLFQLTGIQAKPFRETVTWVDVIVN